MIPYQMITNFDSLEIRPENEFFQKKGLLFELERERYK